MCCFSQDVDAAQDIVQAGVRVWRLSLNGKRQNVDSLIGPGGTVPMPFKKRRI